MRTSLQDLFVSEGPILADGGMGTMLVARGLERGAAPEGWNVEHPSQVQEIHRAYLQAGAQIILTNSFGGNRIRLQHQNLEEHCHDLNRTAGELACAAADQADHPVVIGGSMGPTGSLMTPLGDLTAESAARIFQEQAAALLDGGVDVLWIETFADLEELHAAVEGCRAADEKAPIIATMTFDSHGHTTMGVSPQAALQSLQPLGLEALGANCGNGPEEIETVIAKMRELDPQAVLVAKANAGVPRMEGGHPVYDATPQDMAEHARRVHRLGARIIGACCGSTPDHIAAMSAALFDEA